jgi:hypothetical protein
MSCLVSRDAFSLARLLALGMQCSATLNPEHLAEAKGLRPDPEGRAVGWHACDGVPSFSLIIFRKHPVELNHRLLSLADFPEEPL